MEAELASPNILWPRRKTAAWLGIEEHTLNRACAGYEGVLTADGVDILRAATLCVAHYKVMQEKQSRQGEAARTKRALAEAERSSLKIAKESAQVVERDAVNAILRDWQVDCVRDVSSLGLDEITRDRILAIMREATEKAANGLVENSVS